MEFVRSPGVAEVICLRLDEGEDVQQSVEALAAKLDIRAGAVLSGVATLKRACLHMVTTTGYPPKEAFLNLTGPIEVASISGIIADRQPHLHATITDSSGAAFGGHLEPGCIVLYLAEIVVVRFEGPALTRVKHPRTGIKQLKEKPPPDTILV